MLVIKELTLPCPEPDVDALAGVLHACVHAGASVSFILPFSQSEARAWFDSKVLPELQPGKRRVFVARLNGRIVGAVHLLLDMPPNQQHRAEVAKLLVHPQVRRQGVARALMGALENAAREENRTLLTLDTRTGDNAEPLYLSMGYIPAGVIPGYARGLASPGLEATSILYKELRPNSE